MAGSKTLLAALFIACVNAQDTTATSAPACASTIAPKHAQPSVAPGWNVQVVASGLTNPRGIIFDSEGHMLVVQQDRGIVSLTLTGDEGACVRAEGGAKDLVVDGQLNHGIQLSDDGKTLYASTAGSVYSWDYDASQARNTSGPKELINDFGPPDVHFSRTLLLSRQVKGMLLVSRGSKANLDPAALDPSTGVSTIKAFNISNITDKAYSFAKDGLVIGWGLRNSVGVGEDPATGGIYSVENSVDDIDRLGKNIHQNNPGEEMNFHGYLNGTKTDGQGGNHGYPSCFAAWNVDEIPLNENIKVGTQFAIGDQNATLNDTFCRNDRVAPRLTFAAHMAPLDIKFNSNGTTAWVTFHGSWNRDEPIGYKLVAIAFENGAPSKPADSADAAVDIVSNVDVKKCPDECFRPVGLAWDKKGRLFMSSDTTGEIYVVTRENGSANDAPPSTTLGAATSLAQSPGAAAKEGGIVGWFGAVLAGVMASPLL